MRKKLLTLFLLCTLLISSSLVAFAAEDVSSSDALAAANAGTAYIIDVRSNAKYAIENLDHLGSSYIIHQAVFDDQNKLDTAEAQALQEQFVTNMTAIKTDLESKKIYILCNSGRGGAAKAKELLTTSVGISEDIISTIKNGATDIEIRYAFLNTNNTKTGAEAVAAIDNTDVPILDVRNNAKYNAGHLRGSIHIPVFDESNSPVGTTADDLAVAFKEAVTDNAALQGKDIYILCNGGQRGARAATVLLADSGYDTANIYTITGGATDTDVQAAFAPTISEYKFVSGSDAVKADPATTFIIDVRSTTNYDNGHLENSVNWPLFDAKGVTNGNDALANAFIANVRANASSLSGKKIYILCNSGARGAQAATQLLAYEGYNTSTADDGVVYTIKNGAKDIEVRYAFLGANPTTPVTGTQAVESIGNNSVVIIDVRASGNYASGHLKGSVSLPVFTSNGVIATADDELGQAFTTYVTANRTALEGKEIYLLCNSGQSGARAATVLLKAAGFDLTKIHTITGGAKGTDTDKSVPNACIYVSDTRAINVIGDSNYLILDVRSTAKYKAGHLNGSLSLPVFDADNNLTDDLAAKFSAYVNAHKSDFDGKIIYILCNSGSRGAEKATALLKEAGVNAKIYTIEGGAKSEIIQQHFVTSNNSSTGTTSSTTTVQTGDSSNAMLYVFAMAIALFVFFAVRRKECTN